MGDRAASAGRGLSDRRAHPQRSALCSTPTQKGELPFLSRSCSCDVLASLSGAVNTVLESRSEPTFQPDISVAGLVASWTMKLDLRLACSYVKVASIQKLPCPSSPARCAAQRCWPSPSICPELAIATMNSVCASFCHECAIEAMELVLVTPSGAGRLSIS